MPSKTLYSFPASVWATAPRLAIIEYGYSDIDTSAVNLVEGENFLPEFVNINPDATLPTLVVGNEVFTDTKSVISYLAKNAPVPGGKSSSADVIAAVHQEDIDPNSFLLSTRSEEELKGKGGDVPGAYIRGRQSRLKKLLAEGKHPEHKAFWEKKLAGNTVLFDVYEGNTPADDFIAESKTLASSIASFINQKLPSYLPDSGFIGGSKPGEDDFHVIAWLARVVALVGGSPAPDGIKPLEGLLGGPVPPKVEKYWVTWTDTKGWKVVFKNGLVG